MLRKVRFIFWLITMSSLGAGQTTPDPGPPPEAWEAKVFPPPEGEWLKRMPRGFTQAAVPAYSVRVFYLVPSNRSAQSDAVTRMRQYVISLRDYYLDQMGRNGFGTKTILFETEADGVTPTIHVVTGTHTDTYYNTDPWNNVVADAQAAGLSIWSPNQVWMGVFQGHIENPDGSYAGEFNGGANPGSGTDGGLGLVNSNALALALPSRLTDNTPYAGLVIPEFGPFPMAFGLSEPSFDGNTLSSISSVRYGSILHEVSHGFGLAHDFRNDANFAGNLMGNGFRGYRSWVYPASYPSDETRETYASALALNVSRYFNSQLFYTDNVKPAATLLTGGIVNPVNGLLPVSFSATDAGSLSCALLQEDGNVINEMTLSGTSVTQTFTTPYYEPGVAHTYAVNVFDTQGNRRDVSGSITAATGFNRAPIPFFKIKPSAAKTNELVTFDASLSSDPSGSAASLTIEWDLNGDGIFDTAPTTTKTYTTFFTGPETRLIRCRITDTFGAQSVSTPIGLRVSAISTAAHDWNVYD